MSQISNTVVSLARRGRVGILSSFATLAILGTTFVPTPVARAQDAFDILSFDEETMIRYELQNPESHLFHRDAIKMYLMMKVDQLKHEVRNSDIEIELTSQELAELRARLREHEADRAEVYRAIRDLGVHAESVPQSIQQLEKMRAEFEIELAGREARREGVSVELESIVTQIKADQSSDPVLSQLRTLLELRRRDLERVKTLHDQGVVSQTEFGTATAAVAEAELRVIEHEQAMRDTSGDLFVTSLKSDLVSVTVDIAELRAKVVSIQKQLAQLYEAERILQESPAGEELIHEAMVKRTLALEESVSGFRTKQRQAEVKLMTLERLQAGLEQMMKDEAKEAEEASDDDE